MKKGITLTALAIYLVLFFTFTAFVVTITSRYNEGLFTDRGNAINLNEINKLEYNINVSKSKSSGLSKIGDYIVFDNKDTYMYDSQRRVLLFNGGILVSNVDACTFTLTDINNGKYLEISITLKKYLSEMTRTIGLFMEEG